MGIQVTNSYAKKRISLFLTEEWPQTPAEDLEVIRVSEGYCNTVHIIRRKNQATREPAVLILRHYGGNDFDMRSMAVKCSEMEETLIANEMSAKGWGPKLYGVFAGGRVEEFIDSISSTPRDFLDQSLRHELARNYARFHSLQLPLQRNKIETFRDDVCSVSPETWKTLTDHVLTQTPDLLHALQDLMDWDTGSDKEWLFDVCAKEGFLRAFCITDVNALNILIRKDRQEGKSSIVLVDYEMGCYGYAAQDIGGHMMFRMADASNKETMLSGLEYPSIEYITDFVTVYLDERRKLGTVDASLTVDELVRQTLFGSLMFTVLFTEALLGEPHTMTSEKNMLRIARELRRAYTTLKERLMH